MALIISCDYAANEANNVIKVCYKVQENLNSARKEEVFNFLALIDANKPCYTAAGYFELDRSILFTFLSTATTYFIIVVQFNNNKNK